MTQKQREIADYALVSAAFQRDPEVECAARDLLRAAAEPEAKACATCGGNRYTDNLGIRSCPDCAVLP
jgi:hypothetical protein